MPRVALVFPPQGHFTQPYLSLPSLSAYLKQNGVDDVTLLDASIDSYDRFLSEGRLRRSLERVRAGEGLASLEARDALHFSEMERYQTLSEIDLIGDEVAARIEEAKHVLRTPAEFYDYQRYLWAGRTVEQGLRIFSAEYAPSRLAAHGFVMKNRVERSADIIAALSDEEHNPYIEYFREHTLPLLREQDPDLIGLSVTFPSQAIPSLTLARLIKEWKPEAHVTLGGGLLAYVAHKLAKRDEVWGLIDSMVLLEGERPLLALCEAVDGARGLESIENLVWRDDAGEVRVNEQREPLDIKSLPTPDFDGMPLDKYFSPELVMPLAITRGCYWGKCVFCTLYTVIGPGYRGRTIEQTVDDIAALKEKYGARHFYLAIEDLPPNMAKALPRAMIDAQLDVDWWCDARLEHDTFDQEVCDDLAAGQPRAREAHAQRRHLRDALRDGRLPHRDARGGARDARHDPGAPRPDPGGQRTRLLPRRVVGGLQAPRGVRHRRGLPGSRGGPAGLLRLRHEHRHVAARRARGVPRVHAGPALALPRVPEHEHALPRAEGALLPVPVAARDLGAPVRAGARAPCR
jgi:hypothetical protein